MEPEDELPSEVLRAIRNCSQRAPRAGAAGQPEQVSSSGAADSSAEAVAPRPNAEDEQDDCQPVRTLFSEPPDTSAAAVEAPDAPDASDARGAPDAPAAEEDELPSEALLAIQRCSLRAPRPEKTSSAPEKTSSAASTDVPDSLASSTSELSRIGSSGSSEPVSGVSEPGMQVRQEPAAGGGGEGNLFLIALRLRWEQTDNWDDPATDSMELSSPAEKEEAEEDMVSPESDAKSQPPTPGTDSSPEPGGLAKLKDRLGGQWWKPRTRSSTSKSWKAATGRSHGKEGYQFGDISRTVGAFFKQPWSSGGRPTFSLVGDNVTVEDSEDGVQGVVAARKTDTLDHGIAITSAPLVSQQPTPQEDGVAVSRYYFEIEVLEVVPSNRALLIGFVWHPEDRSNAEGSSGTLPASANELPHAFVAGDEPPRWFLGGRDLGGRMGAWRPVIHTVPGSVVGALLEVTCAGGQEARPPSMRFIVYQDGLRRSEVTVELSQPEDHGRLPERALRPYGLVDICGSVQKVKLLDSSAPLTEGRDSGAEPVKVLSRLESIVDT